MKSVIRIFLKFLNLKIYRANNLPWGLDFISDIEKIRNKFNFNNYFLNNSNVIFDVGSNIGLTTLKFKKVYPGKFIYSFEPVINTFNILKKQTNLDNIFHENIAFGSSKTIQKIKVYNNNVLNSLSFNSPIMSNTSNYEFQEIKIDTIDNFCLERGINLIDILKIDTEGFDYNVLLGAKKMLKEKKINFIYFEFFFVGTDSLNLKDGNLIKIDNLLFENGYRLATFYTDTVFANTNAGVYNALYTYNNHN